MSLYKATSELLGKKFKLGSQHPSNGLDCFTLIISYLRNRGVDIPENETFKGFTFETYENAYLKNPNELIQIGIEYIETKTKKIHLSQIIAGDIVVVRTKKDELALGIDAGNGNLIAISETNGVIALNKNNYNILSAYRCLV